MNIDEFDLGFDEEVISEPVVESEPTTPAENVPVTPLNKVEIFLENQGKSVLAFDLSKTSTGLAIYRNGELKTYALQFETKDEDTVLANGHRMMEMVDALKQLLGEDRHFDVICVEEALLGVNAKVSSVAYGLNFFIDYLVVSGVVTCSTFHRINNKSWKASLRAMAGTKTVKVGTDKEKREIIQSFKALGYPLAYAHESFKSWTAYKKSGKQDMLDAVGVMMGTLQALSSVGGGLRRKVTRSVKIATTLEEAVKSAKYPIREVSVHHSNLTTWYKTVASETFEPTSYLISTPKLGRFGVEQKYFTLSDQYFVLVNVNVKEVSNVG